MNSLSRASWSQALGQAHRRWTTSRDTTRLNAGPSLLPLKGNGLADPTAVGAFHRSRHWNSRPLSWVPQAVSGSGSATDAASVFQDLQLQTPYSPDAGPLLYITWVAVIPLMLPQSCIGCFCPACYLRPSFLPHVGAAEFRLRGN